MLANGWNPAGVPVDGMTQMMAQIRSMAQAAGRDPAAIELIVRANLSISAEPMGKTRPIFSGAREEIKADIDAVRALDASELFFDANFSPGVRSENDVLRILEDMRRMI
jgi:alkanesulfonate monooxygenase SsuD/methylene tetrahydromethanopterin reductase-like flavin-dependent oxidoreductase (luciferase family)